MIVYRQSSPPSGAGLASGAGAPAVEYPRLRPLLRVPLFYKILLAGAAIVFAAVLVCTLAVLAITARSADAPTLGVVIVVAMAGALASLPLQILVLRLALGPIEQLAEVAGRIERGESGVRVAASALADPQLERLGTVFNRALDRMAADNERLKAVAKRAFQAQEAERLRIARELQEETAQSLATMLLQLRAARQARDPERAAATLDELRAQLAATTEAVRRYARGLYPPALRELGLKAAVEGLARTFGEVNGLEIEVIEEGTRGTLAPQSELALYRIVQEALNNVVRHADAGRARVELLLCDGDVEVTVEDDGRGFDLAVAEKCGSCLGLYGMQERALYAGGATTIDSGIGEGTRVRVRIPASPAPTPAAAPAPALSHTL